MVAVDGYPAGKVCASLPLEPDFPALAPEQTDTLLSRRSLLKKAVGASSAGAALLAAAGCRPRNTNGKITIRYMAWGNPEQLALEQGIAEDFEKRNPHIHVHLFMVPGSAYADKLQLMLASRTAPDVMRVDHYLFPSLARKQYFHSLEPFIAEEKPGFLDDFSPLPLEECRWKNELFAMNVLFGGVFVYYNKKMLQEAGLPEPYLLDKQGKWDWDTFVQFAQAMTKREGGRVMQYGTNMVGFPMNASVIWNQGGDYMNADLTRMTMATDENAIRGLQEYADLRWKYKCAPTPADNALSAFSFESGKIGMNWGWAGDSPRYRKAIKSFDWDIAPTPSGPARNTTVIKGNQLCVYRESQHPREAWEFIKYMTGPEVEMKLGGELRRTVPTRNSVRTDPHYLEAKQAPFHTDVFLEGLRRGRTLPIDWRYGEWSTEFGGALDAMYNLGTEDAKQAAVEATRRVNAVLSSEEGF